MNLTKIKSILPAKVRNMVAIQRDMMQDFTISDQELAEIAGLLHHTPEDWLYLHSSHPLRARANKGLKAIIPYLPDDAVVLVHAFSRWCVVAFDDIIYPAIFQSTPQATYPYKMITGAAARWLSGMRDDVAKILAETKFIDGETSPQLANFSIENDPVAKLTGAGFRGF